MDLASSEGGLEMENNQYYDILTNAMSGDMLVVPMAYGSHFGEVMRMFPATLFTPPENKTLDYGDLNQSERSRQELRAYKYNFIPRKNGIAPHLHWQDKRPPDLSLPMFGSRIVYRQ